MFANNRIHELLEFFKTNPLPEEIYESYCDRAVLSHLAPAIVREL
jgi:hypothetical protein